MSQGSRYKDSALYLFLLSLFCFWWAYQTGVMHDCHDGRRLVSHLMSGICGRAGKGVAALVPLSLGLYLLYAAFTAREED